MINEVALVARPGSAMLIAEQTPPSTCPEVIAQQRQLTRPLPRFARTYKSLHTLYRLHVSHSVVSLCNDFEELLVTDTRVTACTYAQRCLWL